MDFRKKTSKQPLRPHPTHVVSENSVDLFQELLESATKYFGLECLPPFFRKFIIFPPQNNQQNLQHNFFITNVPLHPHPPLRKMHNVHCAVIFWVRSNICGVNLRYFLHSVHFRKKLRYFLQNFQWCTNDYAKICILFVNSYNSANIFGKKSVYFGAIICAP